MIGLVAAVNSQKAQDRIEAVGWDLSDQAVGGLKAGWLKGVVQQNTFEFGHEAMNSAIDLACGRGAPANIPVPTQIVTPENVADYMYYLRSNHGTSTDRALGHHQVVRTGEVPSRS
ncbi:hypothetical protein GCM10020255_029380 [Rhodococcus baikonurensis]